MDSLHVVTLVPAAWKAIIAAGPLAALELAEIWVHPVVVHSVHFTFMSEQASIRRESQVPAIFISVSITACVGL